MVITIMNEVLPTPTSVGTTKTIYDFPEGTITQVDPPSTTASDYTIIYNGVEYVCNYFLDGTTKIKASYQVDGHDSIFIEYYKATGKVQVGVRHDEHETGAGDTIVLVCTLPDPIKDDVKTVLVRFTKDKALYISFNLTTDEYNVEVI